MKKVIIMIIAIIGFATPSYSQFASDRYRDVRESDGWLQKGYRGFVELGGGGDVNEGYGSFFINTTHGYQFSEWFFAGIGLGYLYADHFHYEPNLFEYYGDIHLTIPTTSRFYPFADFKIGGASNEGTDLFIHGGIGVRVALNETLGLSLGLNCYYVDSYSASAPFLGAALGFDF